MSQIKITAIRSKDITWSGGVFKKYEVKTDKTGDAIVELRIGDKAAAKVQAGHTIEGYLSDASYTGKNGKVDFKVLKKIDAEYVYKLLLKLAPGIETERVMPTGIIATEGKPITITEDDGLDQMSDEIPF